MDHKSKQFCPRGLWISPCANQYLVNIASYHSSIGDFVPEGVVSRDEISNFPTFIFCLSAYKTTQKVIAHVSL